MPDEPMNIHRHKAEIENQEMMSGQAMGVAYYDPPEVHVPIHRDQQVQAELTGNMQAAQIFEEHIRQHLQVQAMNAAEAAQAANPAAPVGLPSPQGSPLNIQVVRAINKVGDQGTHGGVKE
jgi:hypothetical protein